MRRRTHPGTRRLAVAALVASLLAVPAVGAPVAWEALAAPNVVRIVTHDADGAERETKIWVVALDGDLYIRTGGTRWYANLERQPDAVLLVEGVPHPVRIELVGDSALRDRVEAAFRAKYGIEDLLVDPFRLGKTHIMRLLRR